MAKERINNTYVNRLFNIPKSTFYMWKKKYDTNGAEGLKRKMPVGKTYPHAIKPDVAEKILIQRKKYQFGSWRIKLYLERYYGICISESSVYQTLKRNGVNRLGKHVKKRTLHGKLYEKAQPGHHVQVDAKFVNLFDENNNPLRRYQYTAIDDSTRIITLKFYNKHNEVNAIDFIGYVVNKFPFRINTIRTDNGHEFQAKFHWHFEDLGMRHQSNKTNSAYLNGKVERSHRTDYSEFYQLLTHKYDVDLTEKLARLVNYYNFKRQHGSFEGKTPFEVLKSNLEN